jgi:MerC mercury resistance protein
LLRFDKYNSLKINWDALGVAASVACAIHCAILPLFLTSLPFLGINILHNQYFEIGMILLAFAIGIYSLSHGYKKHHHNKTPLLVFTIGFVLLVAKQFFVAQENWFLAFGVVGIISAHFINYRLCRKEKNCHVAH